MFIERSTGRIRFARTVFLLVCLLPCAAIAGWAVHLRSAAHREAVRTRWQQVVGLPLIIDAVEHPRPGMVRAMGCAVLASTGVRVLEIPSIELESAVGEDRLRIDAVRIDAAAAALLGELAREWLHRDARHPRNCVIEVADFAWDEGSRRGDDAAIQPPTVLRVECVARDGSRAVRVVRRAASDEQLRIVRAVADEGGRAVEGIEVEASWSDAVPLPILAALAGHAVDAAVVAGPTAVASGEVAATLGEVGWSGKARGRVEGVDLARCTAAIQARAAGRAAIIFDRLTWKNGRLEEVVAECSIGAGWIESGLFDRLVIALGCKPGPAAASAGQPVRSFDAAGCVLRLEGGRLGMTAAPSIAHGLAVVDGAVLLQPPAAGIPFDRLAWMLSPPAAPFVPAGGPGGWLMSILPNVGGGDPVGNRASNPPSGGGRRDF
ncbi:MAG: hypothetical protein K8S94_07195 [Planctomycetia bacterium]|nr:hypothetical protein [Planctomycetia bacterium]